jgi:hypothetical protein
MQCPETIIRVSTVMTRKEHTSEILLGLLDLHHALFERVPDVETDGGDLTDLPDTIDASKSLFFDGGVPVRFHEIGARSFG